jgi:hypothetical protein
MQNRLILTLWLVGAVLYAGSTVFLAHAVLGGGSSAPDKAKGNGRRGEAMRSVKDSVASADTKPAKPAAEAAEDRRHRAEKASFWPKPGEARRARNRRAQSCAEFRAAVRRNR